MDPFLIPHKWFIQAETKHTPHTNTVFTHVSINQSPFLSPAPGSSSFAIKRYHLLLLLISVSARQFITVKCNVQKVIGHQLYAGEPCKVSKAGKHALSHTEPRAHRREMMLGRNMHEETHLKPHTARWGSFHFYLGEKFEPEVRKRGIGGGVSSFKSFNNKTKQDVFFL